MTTAVQAAAGERGAAANATRRRGGAEQAIEVPSMGDSITEGSLASVMKRRRGRGGDG